MMKSELYYIFHTKETYSSHLFVELSNTRFAHSVYFPSLEGELANFIYKSHSNQINHISNKIKALYFIATFLLFAFSIYNSFTHYPLRWSEAFFSKNNKVNQFALNPILYFFDSFAFRTESVNMEEFKKYYPVIAEDLNLPKDSISFERKVVFNDSVKLKQKPNVVFIKNDYLSNK